MRRIQKDTSSHCRLACPSCPTASGATRAAMGAGHLDVDAFTGEMFLNPRLRELLRIASEHWVVLHADNGTNLNRATAAALEALVRYRFDSL